MTQPIHQTDASGRRSAVRKTAFLLMTLVTTDASAQQKPTTGYAPVNGINMYYEVHGDPDGVRRAHVAEMFRLKGGEIHGKQRSAALSNG